MFRCTYILRSLRDDRILNLLIPSFPKLQTGPPRHGIAPKELELLLKACECGGRFSAVAQPRSPKCHERLSPVEATRWIEDNAPGSKKGWHWQKTWNALYCIVIENRVV